MPHDRRGAAVGAAWTQCRSAGSCSKAHFGMLWLTNPATRANQAANRATQAVPANQRRWNIVAHRSPRRLIRFFASVALASALPAIGLGTYGRAWSQTASGRNMDDVKALVYDVFGTLVDWRGGVARESQAILQPLGYQLDWIAFADAWRAEYQPAM